MRRLLSGAALLLASCAGCNGEPRVVAVLHWGGFRPGCLVLRATPAGATGEKTVTFPIEQPERAGDRRVAVFAPAGEGPLVALVGEALEHDCDGGVVARAEETVVVSPSGPEQTLALSADDVDDDGYLSDQAVLPGTDCQEGAPTVHPKPNGETSCDGLDDDCSGAADDAPFNVGQPCFTGPCQGTQECNGPGAARCSAVLGDWYQDLDGDDAGGLLLGSFCGPDAGLTSVPGDCDDNDPLIHPGAVEVCNGKDDDCNGTTDDFGGTCVRAALPASAGLLAVNAGRPGRAWAAGLDGGVFVLSADGGVVSRSGVCGQDDWRAVWVDAQDRAYLGAPGSHVAFLDAGQGGCWSTTVPAASQVNGAWGYPLPDGGTQALYVTSNANIEYWAPPAAPLDRYQVGSGNHNMRAIDGIPPFPRIAAGWFVQVTLRPQVWIDTGAGGFVADPGAEALVGSGRALYSVWMPRADLAYACGDMGTVIQLRNGTWSKLPSPAPELPELSSIAAFDENHVYVAGFGTGGSYVWAWDGSQWKVVVRVNGGQGSVHALGGTGPGDLWAVGSGNAWHLVLP